MTSFICNRDLAALEKNPLKVAFVSGCIWSQAIWSLEQKLPTVLSIQRTFINFCLCVPSRFGFEGMMWT